MRKQRIVPFLLVLALLSIFQIPPAQAQGGSGWSEPYRLSSDDGKASESYMVADQYGYVHCFWTEMLFQSQLTAIKYSRFDGATWTKPNDIYLTGLGIKNVSPVVDKHGILHIAWSESLTGIVFYSYAPANNALSVQSWAKPLQIDIAARPVNLRIDSKGVFHIVYIDPSEDTGVYYVRSEDNALTWTEPLWIDPDIPPGFLPDSLSFELDEKDGLHAAWFYGTRDRQEGSRPDFVRYAHSLDGGKTWSTPYLLDQNRDEIEHELTNASPRLIAQGQTIHVIWAAGSLPYRFHSYSLDAGLTWSTPAHIFGSLHGQAFDGLAIDGAGRLHFFGQIRYPMGIHHMYWDQNRWSKPSLVYWIADAGSESHLGDRVHAHHTVPVIRAGNQMVLTFGDGPADPNRRLFVTYRTLSDVSPIKSAPTPIPTATPIQPPTPTPSQPTPVPSPTATTAPLLQSSDAQPLGPIPGPDFAIRVALIPTLLVLAGTMMIQFLSKRKS